MELLRVTQTIGGVVPICSAVGTESLKFSSGLRVNMVALFVVIGSMRMLEKWSRLQVSALTFHSVLSSSLITDFISLLQSDTMTWNACSGSERRV